MGSTSANGKKGGSPMKGFQETKILELSKACAIMVHLYTEKEIYYTII
jgi:hypothetical protein